MLTKEEKKEEDERKIFSIFASLTYGVVDGFEIDSRRPPKPDILYHSAVEATAFDMGNCLESEIQQDHLRRSKSDKGGGAFWANMNLCAEVLESKLNKKDYESNDPVELLIYYGRFDQNVACADDYYVGTLYETIGKWNKLKHPVQFRRIWYLGENSTYLIYSALGEPVYNIPLNSGYPPGEM